MCQNNCNINEIKNKPLTQTELGKIEAKLDEGYNATQIAEYLGRDASCIQKEIKKFSVVKPSKKECKDCKNYEKCNQRNLCGYSLSGERCNICRECKVRTELCKEYEPVNKVINEIENEVVKLKKQGITDLEIIIIADHGQINVTEEDITMDFEKYNKYFYALPGIDYGTATYYVRKDKKDEFLKEFKNDYKDKMYIFETNKFIKNKIFGKNGVSQYMKSNLGEFISFCKKGAYFVNTIDDTEKYIGKIKGSHSGFSREELMIPLIVINT